MTVASRAHRSRRGNDAPLGPARRAVPGLAGPPRQEEATARVGSRAAGRRRPDLGRGGWWVAAAAAAGFSVTLQCSFGVNPDTSWLLDVAERTLGGSVPYRDILETNPPASFLVFEPAVVVGWALGVSREAATVALVLVGAALSVALSGSILDRAALIERARRPALLFAAAMALVVMPMGSFAQREHIAVLAILPALASLGVRSRGQQPGRSEAVLAGLGAGVAVAIKPVFLLALVGPVACVLARPPRTGIVACVECWIAGAVVLAYAGAVAFLFPDYATRVLPLVTSVYLPARLGLLSLLALPILLVWAVDTLIFSDAGGWRDPVGRVLVLASGGFALSVLVQGKGFTYHGYPALALGGLACAVAVSRADATRARAVAAAAALLAGTAVLADQRGVDVEAPGLAAAVVSVSPHPRLLTIGNDIALATAFARGVGGSWVGSTPTAWVTNSAAVIARDAERSPAFAAAIEGERDLFAADIVRARPDAILVENDAWLGWARRGPALAQALAAYAEAGRFGPVILLARGAPSVAGQVTREAGRP